MLRRTSLLFPLFATACVTPGDRTNGHCPAGETCSAQTPNGLGFMGSRLQGTAGGVVTVALGGTETIRALNGIAVTSPPFGLTFNAASTTSALAVTGTTPPDTMVHGLAEGSTYLRLVEPGTGLLFDRTQVDVKAIDHSFLRASDYNEVTADQAYAVDTQLGWAMLSGGTDTVSVSLYATDNTRLTDEGIVLGVSGSGFGLSSRPGWDMVAVQATGGGSGTVAVRTGDGVVRDGSVRIAPNVTDVLNVPAVGAKLTSQGLVYNVPSVLCFRAVNGSDLVAGVTWSWSAPIGVTIGRPLLNGKNCITVQAPSPGTTTITATASGTSRGYPVTFVAARPVPVPGNDPDPAEVTPGERALEAASE